MKAFIGSFLDTQLYDVYKRAPPPPPADYMVHPEHSRGHEATGEGGGGDSEVQGNGLLALLGGDDGSTSDGDGGDSNDGGSDGAHTAPGSHASPLDDGMDETGFVEHKFNLKIDLVGCCKSIPPKMHLNNL